MKIIITSIFSILISLNIFAAVSSFVDKTEFYAGDSVSLTISASGSGISLPNIAKIGNYPILSISNSKSISITGGRQSEKVSKTYVFKPTNDLIIPSFKIEIAGKIEKTQAIKITKIAITPSKLGDDFVLSMTLDKTDFFVGEAGSLKIVFKTKKSLENFGNVNINPVSSNNLSFKTNNKFVATSDKNYNIWTIHYNFTVNNFGTINIPATFATISKNTSFSFFQTQSIIKKVYANALVINAKPLPNDLIIYGDFVIKMSVDKNSVKTGEAVNVVVKITGAGNIDAIEKFKINIKNATIYSDEVQINNNQWTQKFAIIGQDDFVIPSIKLDFFDKITKAKKTIKTKETKIKVIGNFINKVVNTQNNTRNNSKNNVETLNKKSIGNEFYYLLAGVLFGLLICWLLALIKKLKNQQPINKQHKDLIRAIKFARSDKSLFDILLPLNLKNLSSIMIKLEENIYKKSKHKISKKAIIKLL